MFLYLSPMMPTGLPPRVRRPACVALAKPLRPLGGQPCLSGPSHSLARSSAGPSRPPVSLLDR
ncbi:hypothetical protein E2562_006524 [Oryza meyeriana var. granulata]|uniref:Uncharacterized protein n=1 Tax=Oryza meyeriana var. granulata TaxID=110450 RepID=A0A6G1BS42_9ORYZ|nr:hypothetical protein E2562_006524 [Oryza meyeriana var. granulata]